MIRNLQSLSLRQPLPRWCPGLCVPITLSANAVLPFDVGRYLKHLTLGNLMIGLLEGGLLIYWLALGSGFFGVHLEA